MSRTDGAMTEPQTLYRLVEDSGFSFAVIEECIQVLKRGMAQVDLGDEAVVKLLRAHLLSVGSPTDVGKFFSFELLCRIKPSAAREASLELCRVLAGIELKSERVTTFERDVFRFLKEQQAIEAVPLLAAVAAKRCGDISRQAARAAIALLGTRDPKAIAARLSRSDLPEAHEPERIARSLLEALRRPKQSTETLKEREALLSREAKSPAASETLSLRPERRKERDQRLRAVLRKSGRDPSECGNCGVRGPAHVAHVIPEGRGGTDRPGNLIALCAQCWRKFKASRRDSSGVRRGLEEISSRQMPLFLDP